MADATGTRGRGAEVRFGSRSWFLAPGGSLTVGRSATCDIVLGAEPDDLMVSRLAGTFTCVAEGILVANNSRQQLLLQAIPGPEIELHPGMTVGTMPHARARLHIAGFAGARYLIYLDSSGLSGLTAAPGAPPRRVQGKPTTLAYGRMDLTAAQRRYLAALCEPSLTRIGQQATAASYRAIAQRCNVAPGTVRNCLDQLRHMLSSRYGVPGLTSDDGQSGSCVAALANWAMDSDNVTPDDLELLDGG